ncbi:MAG: FecR domain-containing protein [Parcubacteria group bacterium]|nr:FecR domain-containing protein [Parcubacteria group bacterium]
MKKILILFIVISLISIGIGSVFAMTKEVSLPKLNVFIISVKGDATIKKNNSEEWIKLEKDQELFFGDEIKTGQDGEVAINFYDTSVSQIGPNSQISFDELFIDSENYAKTKVSLSVTIGRVWSRIIKLGDKEAVFEVGSDKTVATVRGTTFDFEVTKEGIANINAVENIVEVSTIKVKEEIDQITGEKKKSREIIAKVNLLEGLSTIIDQRKEIEELDKIETENISETEKESEWFKNNIENEERFIEEIEKKQIEMIEKMAGTLPDSKLYSIKKVTENIRLAITTNQETKEELEMRFASRRLAEAQELIEMGKNELAQEVINEFHNKAEQLFKEQEELEKAGMDVEKIEEMRNKINNQINLQENMINKAAPDEEMYDFKREFEEIKIDFATEENENFLRFKQIQKRLEEADLVKEEGNEELYNRLMEENTEQVEIIRQLDPDRELMERIDLETQIIKEKEFIYLEPEIKTKSELKPEIKENMPEVEIREYIPEVRENIPPIIDEPKINEIDKNLDQTGSILEPFREYIPEVKSEHESKSELKPEIKENIPEEKNTFTPIHKQ